MSQFVRQDPIYQQRLPTPSVDVTEMIVQWILGYTDTTSKTSKLLDETITPGFTEPPDLIFKQVSPDYQRTLKTLWSKTGSVYQASGGVAIDADGIDFLVRRVAVKALDSAKGVKFDNPWPWYCKADVYALQSDFATQVGETEVRAVPPGRSVNVHSTELVEYAKDNSGVYIVGDFYMYHEDMPDNYITQLSTNDGFSILAPTMQPKMKVPYYGGTSFDMYNWLEENQFWFGALAGAEALAAMYIDTAKAFANLPGVQRQAAKLGLGAMPIAGILAYAREVGWLTQRKLVQVILPMLGSAVSYDSAQALSGLIPDSAVGGITSGLSGLGISAGFPELVGTATAGVVQAGLAMWTAQMIDDMAWYIES